MPDWATTPNIYVYAAGAVYVLGYLIINQVILRILIICGTFLYIAYYSTAADEPLWSAIFMSSAQGTALFIGLMFLLVGNSKFAIPRRFLDLYPQFSHLQPRDFRALMRHARRYTAEAKEVLGQEGERAGHIFYIISGGAETQKKGVAFPLPPGVFVGEVAYLLDRPSAATTTLLPGSEVLSWDRQAFDKTSKKSPRLKLAFEAAIARDMAAKVAMAVAPSDMQRASDHGFDTRATTP